LKGQNISCVAVGNRKLLDFIKKIFICVPELNKSLMDFRGRGNYFVWAIWWIKK